MEQVITNKTVNSDILYNEKEIKKKDTLTKFHKDYLFFSIKNSKTPLYAIFNTKTGKYYLKGRMGFLDDLYYIMKDEKYCEGYSTLINKISYLTDKKPSDRAIISSYLDNNDKIMIIDDITFKPVEERIIYEDNCVYLNEYTPTKYLSSKFNNGNRNPDSFKFIKFLLMNLCAGDEKAYEYLLKVLSLSIRKPWVKRHGYIVFQGEGASGKGSFFELIMEPIFKDYCVVDTEEVLRTNFNGYSSNTLWIFIEEKDDTNNKNKGSISSTLKYLTGNKKSVSESKGIDRKVINDYRNYGMTTNETSNIGLGLKKNDRRATVFGFSETLGGSQDKASQYRLKLEEEIPKELDNFVSYLKNMEFEDHEVFTCFDTEAKRQIIEMDMSNVDLFISDLQSYADSGLSVIIKDYNFFDKSQKEIVFNEKEKKYNINIYYNESKKKSEFFILLETMYEMFKKYCENNGKHPLGYNKFSSEFSNSTKIKKIEKYIEGKKKKLFDLNDITRFLKIKFDETSDIFTFIEVKSK